MAKEVEDRGITHASSINTVIQLCTDALKEASPEAQVSEEELETLKTNLRSQFITTTDFLMFIPFQRFDFLNIPAGYHLCLKEAVQVLYKQKRGE